jgi:hypothetical protein
MPWVTLRNSEAQLKNQAKPYQSSVVAGIIATAETLGEEVILSLKKAKRSGANKKGQNGWERPERREKQFLKLEHWRSVPRNGAKKKY